MGKLIIYIQSRTNYDNRSICCPDIWVVRGYPEFTKRTGQQKEAKVMT
jgi:hypothetical protein